MALPATHPLLLADPRFEVLPLDGIEERLAGLPRDFAKVTVTASPVKGIEPTVALAERLAGMGFAVAPHLSARLVRDRGHLVDLVRRLEEAGVRDVFVVGGDAEEPVGEFGEAAELLEAMTERGHGFVDVGITGYPEGHHLFSDAAADAALARKAPLATYAVTQICFDAGAISRWVATVRARGIELPVYVGVTGVVDYAKLLRISLRIGLGQSARFLRGNRSWFARMLRPRYRPDTLIGELTPWALRPESGVAGFHVYTFNEVEPTERWWRALQTRSAPAALARIHRA
jgi:methylenetetrahydrofolate reductase (NADPH)